jgi:DNA-binding GntR family transcriptional regulator
MAKAAVEPPSNESNGQASTQASSVYDRLHTDILTGELKPGLKLRLKDLIARYDTGNSPLREALNRLSANGMVVREENRGFRVPPAEEKELVELTKTRCWLEEIGLRESIANGDEEWEERIVLAYHWLSRAASKEKSKGSPQYTVREWERHHREFHIALISACGSDILLKYCAELHQQSFRYRNLAEVVEYRGMHELEEHSDLQEAVLNRDADRAVKLLKKHYEVTSEILIASGRFD